MAIPRVAKGRLQVQGQEVFSRDAQGHFVANPNRFSNEKTHNMSKEEWLKYLTPCGNNTFNSLDVLHKISMQIADAVGTPTPFYSHKRKEWVIDGNDNRDTEI